MALAMLSGPTILRGNFISSAFTVGGTNPNTNIGFIIMPPAWDPAPVTFQWSLDNNSFYDLFSNEGMEINFIGEPAGVIIPVGVVLQNCPFPYVKFRSGPRANPIPQSADRAFKIVTL